MEPTIKRSLWVSFGLALMASVAAYFLAFFLFTIHEEIGISADAALPIAGCTFPIVLLGQPHWLSGQESGWARPVMALKFQRWNASPGDPGCRSDSSTSGATHGTANSY